MPRKKKFSYKKWKKHKRCRILCLNVPNLVQIIKKSLFSGKKTVTVDDFGIVNACVLQYTKTVFEIPIKLWQVYEIFKWITTYYQKYKHAQPLDL